MSVGVILNDNNIKSKNIIESKKLYNIHKYELQKKNVKLIINKCIDCNFNILLINYDNKLEKRYFKINYNKIIKDIDNIEKKNKKNKKKLSLFENYNPKSTIKNLGFKNKEKAIHTIDIIKDKSILYQKQVITTMYNRAKFHPNQTKEMRESMKIFKRWLILHNVKVGGKKNNYSFLNHDIINYYDKLASYYNISLVARGLEKSKTTNYGFLEIYKRNNNSTKLINIPVKQNKPDGANWYQTRINRINAKLGQMKSQNIPFFHKDGKLKGLPTKMHTILIMWAYSPYPNKLLLLKNKNLLSYNL